MGLCLTYACFLWFLSRVNLPGIEYGIITSRSYSFDVCLLSAQYGKNKLKVYSTLAAVLVPTYLIVKFLL